MTTQLIINELRSMQSQLIHGPDFFGKVADRMEEMQELLRSASAIANREGAETDWRCFADSIAKLGIGAVTTETYRVLPF